MRFQPFFAVLFAVLAALVVLLSPNRAYAHPLQLEPVIVQLKPQESFLQVELSGNVQDIEQIPGYTQPMQDLTTLLSSARVGEGYTEEFRAIVQRYLNDRFLLKRGEQTLQGTVQDLRHEPGEDVTKQRFRMLVRYEQPPAVRDQPLLIENTLFDYLPNARVIVTLGDFSRPLQPGETVTLDPSALAVNLLTNVWSFLKFGVEHIFTGYDHILFIIALLMVAPSLSYLIKTLTGFTVAHSVTLIWITLTGQGPESRLVEILVAVSIIYVGAENLFIPPAGEGVSASQKTGKGLALTASHRFWVATGFGLVHGFAFGQNLRNAGLPEGAALGWSLFSFNLGVEIAQVVIAVIAFPLLQALRRFLEARAASGRPVPGGLTWEKVVRFASLGVVIAGAYWLTQRLSG